MVRQNKQLNHKNSENYRNEVVLIEFNGDDQRHRQKDISRTYGNEGEKEGFIFRLADLPWNHFAHYNKIDNTETVPRIRPLPTGFWPAIIKKKPTKMAPIMALEQYFFCVSLSDSIVGIVIFSLDFGNFKDLAINDDPPADNPQNRKNGDKYSFGP